MRLRRRRARVPVAVYAERVSAREVRIQWDARQGSAIGALRVRKQTLEPAPVRTGEGSRALPAFSGQALLGLGGAMKVYRVVAAAGIAALALGACSAPVSDEASKNITVLTHDSFNIPKELIKDFETSTGYKVTTVNAGDAGPANQLALAKDQYDAVYGIDTYTAGVVTESGLLAEYTSDQLTDTGKKYATKVLSPVDLGDVCVNVDHGWFAANSMKEPATFDDLAKPEYAKLLSLINPAGSTTGFAFLAGVETARNDAESYLSSLIKGGAKIASGWSEAYYQDFSAGEGKGAYPLVLSYASSPAETKGATGSLDSTCVRQVEYAGVVKGSDNEAGAKAFIDFLLSEGVQSVIPTNMYMYPVNDAVKLPADWAQYAKLAENPILPDVATVNAKRNAWLDSWAKIAEK